MTTRWDLNRSVTWRVIDEEAVLVHTDTCDYFSLNIAGTYLWQLLDKKPHSQGELAEALAAAFLRQPEIADKEVQAFVPQLVKATLITEAETVDSPPVSFMPAAGNGAAYEPPDLVEFGNIETLILSGE